MSGIEIVLLVLVCIILAPVILEVLAVAFALLVAAFAVVVIAPLALICKAFGKGKIEINATETREEESLEIWDNGKKVFEFRERK